MRAPRAFNCSKKVFLDDELVELDDGEENDDDDDDDDYDDDDDDDDAEG